jgi:4-carboxymuconolactone decarboxylase
MISRMRAYHPDLAEWILSDGYGRVLARPGLSIRERELLVVAVLAALDIPLQLRSHVEGARRVGATPGEIRSVLEAVRRR